MRPPPGRLEKRAWSRANSLSRSLHSDSGHLPPGSGGRLIDDVLDLPELQHRTRIETSVPRGDEEFLVRLQERCEHRTTHIAGVTLLVAAELVSGRGRAQAWTA